MTNVHKFPFAHIGHTRPRRNSLIADLAKQLSGLNLGPATPRPAPVQTMESNLTQLFRQSPIITVLAQVQNWTLAWAGRISCTLCTSIGDITIHVNRDKLPIEIQDGSWVQARLLLARSSGKCHTLLSAKQVMVEDADPTCAWLPTAAYVSEVQMSRLRRLLTRMEPAAQAIFMGSVASSSIQQGFLARVSATDHHQCLGGLFVQSVTAAEMAHANPNLGRQERDIAALICLLFDLGKVNESPLRADDVRVEQGLRPHPKTAGLLAAAMNAVANWSPAFVEKLRSVLTHLDCAPLTVPTDTPSLIQQCVKQAIINTWQAGDESPQMGDLETLDLFEPAIYTKLFITPPAIAPASISIEDGLPAAGDNQPTDMPFTLQWAAGFADGEGCIHISKLKANKVGNRKASYRLLFCIGQNNREVLQHFLDGMGVPGKIHARKLYPGQSRRSFQLNYNGVHAMQVINKLAPYLVRKQVEAQVAQNFWMDGKCGQRPPEGGRSWPLEVQRIRASYCRLLKALK